MARWGLVAALALALSGCGGDGQKPGLTVAQRHGLSTRVELIRQAAAAGDLATTQRRLRGFRREVLRLRQRGALDATTARALVVGAIRADARAGTEVVPPPAPTPPAETVPPGQKKKKHGKEDKKKHGKHGEEGDG